MDLEKKDKFIWIYWHQGWDNAPEIIQICRDSWVKKNPGWKIKLLDINSINQFIDIKIKKSTLNNLCIAHQSDIIRLCLLEKYGGVWVDASLFCIIPLDNWIGDFISSGIFMFESNTRLTIIANWFIASERNNELIKKLKLELLNYWGLNNFIKNKLLNKFISKLVSPILNFNKITARLWLNILVMKYIKVYPYQIFYFIFEKTISENEKYRKIWFKTPKINKYNCWPNKLINQKTNQILKDKLKNEFIPLLKLDWRLANKEIIQKNTLISYLIKKYL